MTSREICDLLILHGPDAAEWCQYLVSLFETNHHIPHLAVGSYELSEDCPISKRSQKTFQTCRCILILLSGDLESTFDDPGILESLRKVLTPPTKVIVLFCGVIDKDYFTLFFQDWPKWKSLSSDDDPDLYITAVLDSISEDSGCGSVSDTDAESDKEQLPQPSITEKLLTVQPDRIRCGVKTQIYLIFKCKLDSRIKNEVYFVPMNGPSTRLPATLQNEYMLSVDAPDLPSGLVFLKVFSGDLVLCETKISYFTDMEEISNLLDSASNPVEFMCQAFKIMPYDRNLLDKTLTESLKNNIPASGLHLFGINQIEEENVDANQRDEELPTLLHFAAKYGLKNLTALLLTCPGALQAYSVANKNGDFPNKIAEKYGYMDLRQFIDEYVETADLLRSHIKEELRHDNEDDNTYESMANLSADLLMKYTMQPDTEIYLPMKGVVSPCDTDSTYIDMTQVKGALSSVSQVPSEKDSMIRRILEGSSAAGEYDFDDDGEGKDLYDTCVGESFYQIVHDTEKYSGAANNRPPVPVPRPTQLLDTKPYIAQFCIRPTREENVYVESSDPSKEARGSLTRDRQQSSVYDPFVGMKTPGQRELITLQNHVKLGVKSVEEAVLEFKEWQMNQKRRSDSFKFQQENLKKLRDSINRRRNENKIGKTTDLDITKPIQRGQNVEVKYEFGIYNSTSSSPVLPTKMEIKRGNWKTDSTSSTASSASNRSSTRSTQSMSSGMEGDNEDTEPPEYPQRYKPRHSLPEDTPPPRPPRIQNRSTRSRSTSDYRNVPKVPPRSRN
ncbi:phosphoinositide 3-kinase adapter protein 1 isoform 2-T2 [Anomaloglossus baeobatrachus]|uniref:phosphoinositide 3-kinase adapter protein 1 isoform X2 n=1 Tax=Anomaloglossus baeobatrachus TaxID=238106 RepID=UPI003F500182